MWFTMDPPSFFACYKKIWTVHFGVDRYVFCCFVCDSDRKNVEVFFLLFVLDDDNLQSLSSFFQCTSDYSGMWESQRRMRDIIAELELDVVGLLESDLQRIVMGNRDLFVTFTAHSFYWRDGTID